MLLGRKEGLKDQTEVFWQNTATSICDADTESTWLAGGFEQQRPTLRHGVLGIFDEVQQYLFQLVERHADGWQIFG